MVDRDSRQKSNMENEGIQSQSRQKELVKRMGEGCGFVEFLKLSWGEEQLVGSDSSQQTLYKSNV